MKRLGFGIVSAFAVAALPLGCATATKSRQAPSIQNDKAPDAIIFVSGMT